jgi:hypothetical protein
MPFISTNNWDTVFGITFKDANAAIIAKGSSPASFTGQHTTMAGTIDVTASFGPWQMSGGSDSLLQMTLPLLSGSVSGAGNPATAFAGSAVIQVSLTYIPQPDAPTRDLKLNTGTGVSVISVNLVSGPDDAVPAIKGALQGWLGANLQEFNHVFAAVDLNDQADTGDWAWLQPTHLGYAIYTEGFSAVDDYRFGVLAMTEHRTGRRLSSEIDPLVIPATADAGFLIAADRVMQEIFLPNIEILFKKASVADFDTRDDGATIYNSTTLGLPDFTLSDGTNVTDAAVDSGGFSLAIGKGSVVVSFTGMSFTYKPGYTVTVDYRSVNAMATDSDGHLQLAQTGNPTVAVQVSESSDQTWKEIWEGIGIAVASAVIGAALGAGVEAGLAARAANAAVAEGVAAAAAEGTEMVTFNLKTVGQVVTEQEAQQAEIAALRSAVAALEHPEAAATFVGFFRASAFKLLGAAIGAAVGGAVGSIPAILTGYAEQDKNNMPTLDGFAAKAIGNTAWSSSSDYSLSSAVLNGALQLGLTKSA